MRETNVDVRGLSFRVREFGPAGGELVLLLHGFPQTAHAWTGVARDLAAAGYRVLAPDQRGYSPGARPTVLDAYALPELAADAIEIALTRAPAFHVVGHDWGGAVAWAVAAARPDLVTTLTAVSTPHPRALREAMFRSLQPLRSSYVALFATPVLAEAVLSIGLAPMLRASGLPAGHAGRYVEAMRAPGALTAALSWYRAARPSHLDAVGSVAVPTMYVWGRRDVALGATAARATAAYVHAPYRFVPLPAGHWIPETRAAELARLVEAHLGEHRAQSA